MPDLAMPPVWFRLPPGFHDVAPADRTTLDAMACALGSDAGQQELGRLLDGLDQLAELGVLHTAIGLHPDEAIGICASLFSLTARLSGDPNPRLSTARTAMEISRSPVWNASTCRVIDLPSTLPCYLVAGTLALPHVEQRVFQARIATSHASGHHTLVLDLSSAATQHHEAYTDILEAVVHTLTFTDPHPAPPGKPSTSRILEVLL
ncbi:hypothetical protein ACFWUW_01765 [Streptomyces sp. NPDC058655]|uniref:hypothetical protein n=1 Tax=unclassified Streptomyces TaxID=2593676 RepID=UPI0036570DD1